MDKDISLLSESNNSHACNDSIHARDNNINQDNWENQRPRRIDIFDLLELFNNNGASYSTIHHITITRLSSLTEEGAKPNMTIIINI